MCPGAASPPIRLTQAGLLAEQSVQGRVPVERIHRVGQTPQQRRDGVETIGVLERINVVGEPQRPGPRRMGE